VFPLLKTFLELLFWNALQDGCHMSQNVGSVSPSKRSSVFEIAKSCMGPNLADGPISISIFLSKTPGQQARHEQGHCHDARSKHQAKVQVFSKTQPHVTMPIFPNNNAGSLFDLSLIFPPGQKHTLV
jgi:hypothetical protein